jgi:hypothetical protein
MEGIAAVDFTCIGGRIPASMLHFRESRASLQRPGTVFGAMSAALALCAVCIFVVAL